MPSSRVFPTGTRVVSPERCRSDRGANQPMDHSWRWYTARRGFLDQRLRLSREPALACSTQDLRVLCVYKFYLIFSCFLSLCKNRRWNQQQKQNKFQHELTVTFQFNKKKRSRSTEFEVEHVQLNKKQLKTERQNSTHWDDRATQHFPHRATLDSAKINISVLKLCTQIKLM